MKRKRLSTIEEIEMAFKKDWEQIKEEHQYQIIKTLSRNSRGEIERILDGLEKGGF